MGEKKKKSRAVNGENNEGGDLQPSCKVWGGGKAPLQLRGCNNR